MKRLLFNKLSEWRISPQRKPLVLLGARQVGKTYILTKFGKQYFKSTVTVNFEVNSNFKDFFIDSIEPHQIIRNLEAYFSVKIDPINTLIFFDEIQECPEALNSLKYFCEQAPEYCVVSAGSLLGLKMKRTKGFPVGKVNFIHLYPLSFYEFLWAMQENELAEYLQSITEFNPLPEPLHKKALGLLKYYLYVGGMPEAVKVYVESDDLQNVRETQLEILKAYEFDFAKHVPKELIMKVTGVWHSIPVQLAKRK